MERSDSAYDESVTSFGRQIIGKIVAPEPMQEYPVFQRAFVQPQLEPEIIQRIAQNVMTEPSIVLVHNGTVPTRFV